VSRRPGAPSLAVLTSHPIQYQAPLWRALSQRLDLTVFFCTDYGTRPSYDEGFGQSIAFDTPLLDGYRYEFLPNLGTSRPAGFFSLCNPSALWRMARFDAVLVRGYSYLTNWLALTGAQLAAAATFMHVETPAFARRSGWRQLVKTAALGPLLRSLDGCLAIGEQNRMFYEDYGVATERISIAPYAVDNGFFGAAASQLGPRRDELRRALGIAQGDMVALFVGKLMRRKHPELLIAALRELVTSRGPSVRAVMVGTGIEEPELRALAQRLGVERQVTFAGFVNQSELPRYYTAADVFVLPAEGEYWGLVANEAMNFGLPLILGPGVAAADDLLKEGENGYRLRTIDAAVLAARLATLGTDPALRARMGASSRTIIGGWGIDQAAAAIAKVVELSVDSRRAVSA
jgi:glycosyltransferase involved in cell wall biosynthesis